MAEDKVGFLSVDVAGGLEASIRAQAAAQEKAAALRVQYDDLSQYKKLVDGLLSTLQESPAHHGTLADGTLPTGALGKGFPQADKLYEAYKTVHTELQKLSKGLAGQIEALGLAVGFAGKSFADVDEEAKRRMLALSKQAEDHYDAERDPYLKKDAPGAAQPPGAQPPGGTQPGSTQPGGTRKGGVLG
ncbi:hypothetical protein [Streptomyces manipurensis]|uniref:hypothetical protein n=1 Tax=Streptomyces manipurensis TaxID=1077945 RepID=UPI003C6EFBC6